jgi:cytochrome c oxidase subunit III
MNKNSVYSQSSPRSGVYLPNPMRKGTARLTLLMVLGSETVFFGMLIAAYLYLRASEADWPFGQPHLAQIGIPAANTLILLASALTAALAGRSIRKGDQAWLARWLAITLGLGLVFIAGQVFEYVRSGMTPSDQAFGGVFFTLMGFHALHMLAGAVVVGLALTRARQGDFTARRHVAIDVGTGFWYYVVGVWVVLFSVLYLV